MSADFSMVCISPKVVSKSGPEQNMPCCAQMAASKRFICSLVAFAISAPPGTIQGMTATPQGKTTGHSVALCYRARVKSFAVSGRI